MTRTARPLKSPRVTMPVVVAGVVGLVGAFVAATPTAFAEGATSPTGMVAVSVPPPVVAGVASTYTLTFANTTTSTTTNVVALASLPAGMTLKNINNCARLGGNQSTAFNCMMPNLAPGASESATFSILAPTFGTYDIPFAVAAAIPDAGTPGASDIVGDTVTMTVNVQPGPTDIQVVGSSSNGSPPLGSTFTYTFQVKNNGPVPAGGLTFDDILPASIQLVGNPAADIGSCVASTVSNGVHCDIGNLGVGQQSTIVLSAIPTTGGVFGNTATIAMTGTDTHPANNNVNVTVQPK
jgi:uncharacterized repeat protein (TIGR01451 family)